MDTQTISNMLVSKKKILHQNNEQSQKFEGKNENA